MNQRAGTYVLQKTSTESYRAFIPAPLPPDPPIDLERIYPDLEKATLAIAELNEAVHLIPNHALFVYMYVRKEALFSSQIEGTQSSFADLMLFEHHQKPRVDLDDVEEVSNYVKAISHGLKRLKEGFPLSLRLLREIHEILLSGGRGFNKLPGEFRRSQNWIGGSRPGNARFVPPPPEQMMLCLSDFEKFLHDKKVPVLIKAALTHVQFETIHPFLDGNGRLGRLLIILLLCDVGLLHEPILYLSLYLKEHRSTYYDLLQEVRTEGTWETWLEFFLEGVTKSAKQALAAAKKINALFDRDLSKIATLGRAKTSAEQVFEYLKKLPQVSVVLLAADLKLSAPTARAACHHLLKLGIIEEVSLKKRDKIYVYRQYLNALEEGAEPF